MKDQDNRVIQSRKTAFMAVFLLALVILYLLCGIFFDFFIPCPFRTITGLRCPGCGLSHAAVSLARLDIRGAFRENALFIPIYSYILFAAAREFIPSENKDPRVEVIGRRIDFVFFIVIILWWILRNIFDI